MIDTTSRKWWWWSAWDIHLIRNEQNLSVGLRSVDDEELFTRLNFILTLLLWSRNFCFLNSSLLHIERTAPAAAFVREKFHRCGHRQERSDANAWGKREFFFFFSLLLSTLCASLSLSFSAGEYKKQTDQNSAQSQGEQVSRHYNPTRRYCSIVRCQIQ